MSANSQAPSMIRTIDLPDYLSSQITVSAPALLRQIVPERRDWVGRATSFITFHDIGRRQVGAVINAVKHRDDRFPHTMVIPLIVHGHVLHVRGTSAPLVIGHGYQFNSHETHWTTGGTGLLVFAICDQDRPHSPEDEARFIQELAHDLALFFARSA